MQDDRTDVNYAMSVNGKLNILLSGGYCLVIICIHSSETHDIELIRLIRETSPLPIIAIVPNLKTAEKVAFFHAGVNVCLEQPVDMAICTAQANSLIRLYLDMKMPASLSGRTATERPAVKTTITPITAES